jgi:hypothetical protein
MGQLTGLVIENFRCFICARAFRRCRRPGWRRRQRRSLAIPATSSCLKGTAAHVAVLARSARKSVWYRDRSEEHRTLLTGCRCICRVVQAPVPRLATVTDQW